MTARIDHEITSGTFSLDGGTWDVDNNVWIVGNDDECIVIDPAHEIHAIISAVAGRAVPLILLTHGHDDHIRSAKAVAAALGNAPIALNAADRELWDMVYPDAAPDAQIHDGETFSVAGATLQAIHTPGHSPGSTCFYSEDLGESPVLFSGDTLFAGGPGATGRSYSSFETIIDSITEKLLTLPPATVVHTGHGDSTTIAAEAPHRQEWLSRGH